ncbi:MAG: hypothetical protein M0Z78_08885 [Betaproteobacteria bacterium]|nr:hypothetical protein [Betaproteobacteria bacterium]
MHHSTPAAFVIGRITYIAFVGLFLYSALWLGLQFFSIYESAHKANSLRVDNYQVEKNDAHQIDRVSTVTAVNYAASNKPATGNAVKDYYTDF